jgi:uroporphyrinogen decarboxylase
MIEIGLNVLIPVQPQAMDIQLLQNRFGDHLAFMGGISTQKTLPFGTPNDVQSEVRNCIEILGSKNNYIISASHEIGSDCPINNLLAFFNEMKKVNGSVIPLLDK